MKGSKKTGLLIMLGVFCMLFLGCRTAVKQNTGTAGNSRNLDDDFVRQVTAPYEDTDYTMPEGTDQKREGIDYGLLDDRITYYSTTAGGNKECGVLLPAGYNKNERYPVIYVLHGNGGDHYDWNREDSYLQTLYGNMAADGTAVKAIIVMADMWSLPAALKENASIDTQLSAYDEFYKDLEKDLMPYINCHYSTVPGREGTAVIGTSQGGTEALIAGFMLLDKIGYIGALAPCAGVIDVPGAGEDAWNTPVLSDFTVPDTGCTPFFIQLTVGSLDPWCLYSTQYYHDVMTRENIAHCYYMVDGAGHEDALWKNGLYHFFKCIF